MLLYSNNDKLFFYLFGGYYMYVQYAEASTCICTYVHMYMCVFFGYRWIMIEYSRI